MLDKKKMADPRYQKVLDAAAKVFSKKGFRHANMSDIAGELGLQKTSLYHHIESKEELLYVILFTACEYYLQVLGEVMSSSNSPHRLLEQAIEAYISSLVSQFDRAYLLLTESHNISGEHRRAIQFEISKYIGMWIELLERGISCGAFRADLNVKMTMLYIFGICNWSLHFYRPKCENSTKKLSQIITRSIMEGIRT